MKVKKISPRGYCYGVVDAMVMARQAAANLDLPRPIYIIGMIVHNQHVTDAFEEDGIVSLDGPNRIEILKQVEKGTVIFTAHGVSPEVRQIARDKGLTVVDATCPDVTRTHDLIREKQADGYEFIYVGKKGHPEPEGAIGVAPHAVHLVESVADVENLNLTTDKIILTNQTTMSQWDVSDIMKTAMAIYPKAEVYNEICLATQVRQEAVAEQAGECDLVLVVGDPKSNNSNRLVQVSEEIAKTTAYRIGDVSEIKLDWLKGVETVGITSGASTPTPITREVIKFIEQYDANDESTWSIEHKVELKRILPKVKAKS